MTCRIVQKQSMAELEETVYLFFFEADGKYSIASRKLILCADEEILLGAELKVKSGTKSFFGVLMNMGARKNLENMMLIHEKISRTPELSKTSEEEAHSGDSGSDSSGDITPKGPPKKRLRPKTWGKKISSSEEEDEEESELSKEGKRVSALLSRVSKQKPIADLPHLPTSSKEALGRDSLRVTELQMKVDDLTSELRNVQSTMRNLQAIVEELQVNVGAGPSVQGHNQVNAGAGPSAQGGQVNAGAGPSAQGGQVAAQEAPTVMIHNGIDLLSLPAPPKDIGKFTIKVLAVLFTAEELKNGIMFSSSRSQRVALDQARISTLFAAARAKYGSEKVAKSNQNIIDACNQKCRDILRSTMRNNQN